MNTRSLAGLVMAAGLAVTPAAAETSAPPPRALAQAVKVTVLSTMLADSFGMGEWGFAALVEVDGHRILFDTGAREETVLRNAGELGIDLSLVADVILSHHHDDHTGGLLTLRRALAARNPAALSRAHIAPGMFDSRRRSGHEGESNSMVAVRVAYEAGGGTFIEHRSPAELFPGVWITGPVPRQYSERNWSRDEQLVTPRGPQEDNLPEDQSLVIDTSAGLVVISGCAHAGMINTLAYARQVLRPAPINAAIGGFHLLAADERTLGWTAERLRGFKLAYLVGAHCTGIEAVYRLRALAKLSRRTAVVGAVGATFTLGVGIDPLALAR